MMPHNKTYSESIVILDFGSQYNQLILRRVRENKVFCQFLPYNTPASRLKQLKPKGIIFSGGPASVFESGAPLPSPEIFQMGIPVLGICYGIQAMVHLLGGKVASAGKREYGASNLWVDKKEEFFYKLPSKLSVWMSHGDRITELPSGFETLAHTKNSPFAAIQNKRKKLYGVQFHPEVAHTPQGKEIIHNFLFRICGCSGNWNIRSFIDYSVNQIREKVGEEKAICALSGGVDSSVTAMLINKAIGKKLICIFVNTGLLREGEPEQVLSTFKNHFHLNLRYVNAEKRFLQGLRKIKDPEKKRKIIGKEFIEVFTEEAQKLGKIDFLAQGTLYPDVIESRSAKGGPSAIIKSHHNVGGLPSFMRLKLLEPLKDLFKDEARKVGRELGLPEKIVSRQPFPGPGFAVRIVGEINLRRLKILRQADAIVREEMEQYEDVSKIWQSFPVLLPIRSVGVMGDARTYEYTIALRAVTSQDGMTADWVRLPHEILDKLSGRIINEVKGVNRVVYDISSKPPSTIEWE